MRVGSHVNVLELGTETIHGLELKNIIATGLAAFVGGLGEHADKERRPQVDMREAESASPEGSGPCCCLHRHSGDAIFL